MTNETLIEQIQNGGNVRENMEQLYNQNKGLLFRICKKYSYIDCMTDIEDLMQQSYIVLWSAAHGYNADQGAFSTYLTKCIVRNIRKYLEDTGRSMRIPIHMQEKIYRYHQVTSHFLGEFNREPTEKEYLYYMDMSKKQLYSLRKTMQIDRLKSIDEPIGEDFTVGDTVIDSRADMESVEQRIDKERLSVSLWDAVEKAVKDAKDFEILESRYKEGCTLKECGQRQGITIEAVRTRHNKAMRKLRSNRKIREIGESEGIAPRPIYKRATVNSASLWDDLTDEERVYMACVM